MTKYSLKKPSQPKQNANDGQSLLRLVNQNFQPFAQSFAKETFDKSEAWVSMGEALSAKSMINGTYFRKYGSLMASLALSGLLAACSSATPSDKSYSQNQNSSSFSNIPILSDVVSVFSNDSSTQAEMQLQTVQYQPFTNSSQQVASVSGNLIADQPTPFNVGDRYVFDNPETSWTVIGRSGNAVFWQADNGDTQITDVNPILPALEWRSSSRGNGRRTITNLSGNMFPMQVGKVISFRSSVTTDQPPYNWEFNWTCTVTGTQMLNTSTIGMVNTFVIACDRQGQDQLTFYYSPDVGHYVRMESKGSNGYGEVARSLVNFTKASAGGNPYPQQNMAITNPAMQNPLTATSGANAQIAQEMPGSSGQGIVGGQLQLGNLMTPKYGNGTSTAGINGPISSLTTNGSQSTGAMSSGTDAAGLPMPSNNISDIFSPLAGVTVSNVLNGNNGGANSLLPGVPVQDQPTMQSLQSGINEELAAYGKRNSLFDNGNSGTGSTNVAPPTGTQLRQQLSGEQQAGDQFTNNMSNKNNGNNTQNANRYANAGPVAAPNMQNQQGGGGFVIHLASYKSQNSANQGWRELSKQFGDLLSGLSPIVREVEVPNKGLYQRLYAGNFASEGEAQQICNEIKARGAYCAVTR